MNVVQLWNCAMSVRTLEPHSPAWIFFCWAAFAIAVLVMGIAVAYMPVENWLRGYLGVAALLLVQASFTLSKTLRDQHEAGRVGNRCVAKEDAS
jgi:hypothetical protein